MNPIYKRNFAVFPFLDWIAAITAHIPNKGEQLVRYYRAITAICQGERERLYQTPPEILDKYKKFSDYSKPA